jgi:uncharacterized protein
MGLIDAHMHAGKLYVGEPPLTPDYLLGFMDRLGIDRAILLPIESPEEAHYYVTTDEILSYVTDNPDRFIAGCCVDPRIGTGDNTDIIRARLMEYRDRGCVAYGEAMSGLAIDDVQLQRVYAACGEARMPVVYHIDALRNVDGRGFPGFERMLKMFPDTVFVGHAQHFWAEISGDVTEDQFAGYPLGPITPGGSIIRLFDTYPNLYADISAGSAHNALTRDLEFGYAFLERFADRLFFGTDLCRHNQEIPQVSYLDDARDSGKISVDTYCKIGWENALRVFGL